MSGFPDWLEVSLINDYVFKNGPCDMNEVFAGGLFRSVVLGRNVAPVYKLSKKIAGVPSSNGDHHYFDIWSP